MNLARVLRAPVDDYLAALEACAADGSRRFVVVVAAALVASWWIYVPIHELLHAYGCLWSGGTVSRLEIDPVYGAALLQNWFPFVAVGSDYAGQLTGFDTKGSDFIYLCTDALPFALTVFPGVALLRAAAGFRSLAAGAALGAAIPLAYAPFLSLPGDYYEMGSVIVSGVVRRLDPTVDPARWRSDDVFALVERLSAAGALGAADLGVVSASAVVGILLAVVTYALGGQVADLFGVAARRPR